MALFKLAAIKGIIHEAEHVEKLNHLTSEQLDRLENAVLFRIEQICQIADPVSPEKFLARLRNNGT